MMDFQALPESTKNSMKAKFGDTAESIWKKLDSPPERQNILKCL
jgi:hypothetical protein